MIYSQKDPLQYYDVEQDPDETVNLAELDAYQDEIRASAKDIEQQYNFEKLTTRVQESQRRRNFLKGIMKDLNVCWDYHPEEDASTSYVRNTMPIYELEKRARFPEV